MGDRQIRAAPLACPSVDIFRIHHGLAANVDPGRIAAQVVSGIGFLGAGTILREGATRVSGALDLFSLLTRIVSEDGVISVQRGE